MSRFDNKGNGYGRVASYAAIYLSHYSSGTIEINEQTIDSNI